MLRYRRLGKLTGRCRSSQFKRMALLRTVSGIPMYGLRALNPTSHSRFLTVWGWIRLLCVPGVFSAVFVAVWNLSRRWVRLIWRSSLAVVTLGCPLRGRSAVVPVWRRRCQSRLTVEWLTRRETSDCEISCNNIVTARSRSVWCSSGMICHVSSFSDWS